MTVEVRRLTARDLSALLDFPRGLYADDPCWVPPLRGWELRRLRAALDPARLALFGAYRPSGALVGTISARRDAAFDADPEQNPVWLGFFECVDDPVVAGALVGAVVAQARAWGARRVRGPMNLSRFEFVGLAVEGLDRLPPLLQAQHRPYYAALLEGCGLQKHHDVYAYERELFGPGGEPAALPAGLAEKAAACEVPGLSVRGARRLRTGADFEAVFSVLNAAYATVPDVHPMSRAAFQGFGRVMFALAGPGLVQIARVGARPVGFAACVPELNEALVACRGRLLPLGWARVLRRLPQIQTAAFKLIGVLPELRGSGVHAALIAAVVQGAQAAGYRRMDGSVIDERNLPMRRVVEGAGLARYRTYRFYEVAV